MLLSSFFARSMAFTHTPKVQLPFALFSETFLTIRQNSLYVTVCIIARPSYRGYFIHSLSTLHYCNAPSLATRLTGDYRDRTYTGKCSPALLDTRKKGSGIVGFLIFLVISSVIGKLLDLIPVLESMELTFVLYIAASFAIAAVLYVISGWIMEKKLSV